MEYSKFYVRLSVLTLVGAFACIFLRPEFFSIAKCVCVIYVPVVYIFFRFGLDDVVEKPILGLASWLALLSVETAILLNIGFWWLPLCALIGPVAYFLTRAALYKKALSLRDLVKNAIIETVLIYCLFAVIVLLIEPLCLKIFSFFD